jgi:hypothetical protein
MPEKIEVWSCKYCGTEYDSVYKAQNCEGTHLHVADMKLGHIQQPGNDKYCYEPQSKWPTFLTVRCQTKSHDPAVYVLVGSSKRLAPPRGTTDEDVPPEAKAGGPSRSHL